jgi:arsenate reductase (glutaredoxin)
MNTLFGITNCQTVKKARDFLDKNSIQHTFWDYKKTGIDTTHLEKWCQKFGWEKVLNRSGMMWRKANEIEKSRVVDQKTAIEFMLKVPTAIKRPVLEIGKDLYLGFDPDVYRQIK